MRVGVIGAGAVGGAFAAVLARAGHEVEVTARGAHLAAIREGGIRLAGAWGEYTARVDAGERLSRAPELAIVATKAQDAVAAITANRRFLRGIPVLVVQNGLEGVAAASAASPHSDVVGALALFASSYLSPGQITVTTGGPTFVGGGSGPSDLPARYIVQALSGAIPVELVPNFLGAQWTKLVVNQVNAMPAITGLSAQETLRHPQLRRIIAAGMRETVRAGLAEKVHFESLQGLSHGMLRLFAAAPAWAAQVLPLLMAGRMGATPNPGSTLQSIRRGQATEIDYLNGAVVRAALANGRTAPVNAALVTLVHEVEDRGAFLTPAEVVARVPLPR